MLIGHWAFLCMLFLWKMSSLYNRNAHLVNKYIFWILWSGQTLLLCYSESIWLPKLPWPTLKTHSKCFPWYFCATLDLHHLVSKPKSVFQHLLIQASDLVAYWKTLSATVTTKRAKKCVKLFHSGFSWVIFHHSVCSECPPWSCMWTCSVIILSLFWVYTFVFFLLL